MDYLYISLNKQASQYAISLDEIFLTLYGFEKRKKTNGHPKLKKQAFTSSSAFTTKQIPGVVYRIKVTDEQHDKVREILCDILLESRIGKGPYSEAKYSISSAEFIAYILISSGIVRSANIKEIEDIDGTDIIYEGDLRKYVAAARPQNSSSRRASSILNSVKKNKKIMEHGTAQYEYVPNEV